MTRLLSTAALAAVLVLAGCADVGDAPEATTTAADTDGTEMAYTGTALAIADSDETVAWTGAKVTGQHVGGFSDVTGSVYVADDAVTGAEIDIDMTSIYSDNDDLTGHLKSDDFFDVETHPAGSFRTSELRAVATADSVDWAGATHLVTGVLTMHGESNQITFPAQITTDGTSATVLADFNIDRQNWGISYPGAPDDLIQDEVNIRLNVATAGATGEMDADAPMVEETVETELAE